MDECKVIADLLPTYCDELTGWDTNTWILAHLNSCPNCSRLLEKMKQDRDKKIEVELQMANFRAALSGYQQRHKNRMRLLGVFCLLLVAAFFVLRAFSLDMAISASGLRRTSADVVYGHPAEDSNKEFQVIRSRTKEGERPALAYLTKNALGFWSVSSVQIATPDQLGGTAQILWNDFIYSNHFGEPDIGVVMHRVYVGDNAIGALNQFPQDQLPDNVSVEITQNSAYYCIHVITVVYGSGTSFDILPLLKENNLIS